MNKVNFIADVDDMPTALGISESRFEELSLHMSNALSFVMGKPKYNRHELLEIAFNAAENEAELIYIAFNLGGFEQKLKHDGALSKR